MPTRSLAFAPPAKSLTMDEYMATLDPLTRRNTGSRILQGEDINERALPLPYMRNFSQQQTQGNTQQANPVYFSPRSGYEIPALPEELQVQPVNSGNVGLTPQEQFYQFYGLTPPGEVVIEDLPPGTNVESTGQEFLDNWSRQQYQINNGLEAMPTIPGNSGQPEVYPVASLPGNRVQYSDGSIRYGNYLYETIPGNQAGIPGLASALTGDEYYITQPYGNLSDRYASGVHGAIDLRTRDLVGDARNLNIPADAIVDEVRRADDGNDYGNSIRLILPSGQMIRISHLSYLPDFRKGDLIRAGETIGVPGSTGNSTGEHLDIELYQQNAEGRYVRVNPEEFMGYADPGMMARLREGQPEPGSLADTSDLNLANLPYSNPTQTNSQQNPQSPSIPQQQNKVDYSNLTPTTPPPARVSEPAQYVSNVIEKVSPTGDSIDFGVSEMLRGDARGAQQVRRSTGDNIIQELTGVRPAGDNLDSFGNRLATSTSAMIENTKPTGNNFDLGVSEALRGDFAGAGQIAKNTINQGLDKIGDTVSGFASTLNPFNPPKAQAAELSQAGQGVGRAIENAQSYYQGGPAPSYANNAVKREVGDSSSSTAPSGDIKPFTPISPSMNTNTVADSRDNFFKAGGAKTYADLINVGDDYRGALTPGLFKDEFFENPQNIADVFGNSAYGKEATDRFRQKEAAKYPGVSIENADEYGYQNDANYRNAYDAYRNQANEYNSGISNYLKSIPEVLNSRLNWGDLAKGAGNAIKNIGSLFRSDFGIDENTTQDLTNTGKETVTYSGAFSIPKNPNAPRAVYKDIISTPEIPRYNISAPSRIPTLEEYHARGKTTAQWLAETGQQSVADSVGGYQNYENIVNEQRAQQAQAMQRAAQMSQGGTTSVANYMEKAKTNMGRVEGGDYGGVYGANSNTQNPRAVAMINGQSRPMNTLSELEKALIKSGNAWGIKR